MSRKLLKVPIRHRNFRANFAAAMRVGKGTNAGSTAVELRLSSGAQRRPTCGLS
ncbi:hypothetical protein ACFGOO_09445 [Treponema vincentii]|uniref:hypothetical protein n=1 Tax=Treponema vincentii TaxID=69710 RepID=UPI0035F5C11F